MAIPSRKWRRWHRWLGLAVVVPVLVLATTGLLLNHLELLHLNQRPLPVWLASVYGIPESEPALGHQIDGQWWVFADERLYKNDLLITECAKPYAGVVQIPPLFVVGCGQHLLLVGHDDEVLERLDSNYGVPPFKQIGVSPSGQLVLASSFGTWVFQLDQLRAEAYQGAWQAQTIRPVPEPIAMALTRQQVPAELNWQRLLLDIHSGRVLTGVGTLIMDIAAFLLIGLAMSGVVIWWRTRP